MLHQCMMFAYYSQRFSITSCLFLKPAQASTNGYWFSSCHLTSLKNSGLTNMLQWLSGVVVRMSDLRLAVVGSNLGHVIAGFLR